MDQTRSKTIKEKIAQVDHEIHLYGKLTKYEIRKIYFCKKLNKAMRDYEKEIKMIAQHIALAVQDKKIFKELYKK